MLPKPVTQLTPNSAEFETTPLIRPTGFREYDVRWRFPEEINLIGVQALGLGLAEFLYRKNIPPAIIVGHDFRAYSLSIKQALTVGLMAGGAEIYDIGLALSPMAYFAQFALDVPSVAMVTASHNDNGWTGVKMGCNRPLTFGPDDINALQDIVMNGQAQPRAGGRYQFRSDVAAAYRNDLTARENLQHARKVVVACGNGTAGAFAPDVLRAVGAEVVELDCALDHNFPRYNPNPEDMIMLSALKEEIINSGAALGLAFDGDGDRCGVVDERGDPIFVDKVGVLLARDIARRYPRSQFVADVKSTGLFASDPELQRLDATCHYWKTGHSYIKRHCQEIGAIAGFEKSGHIFLCPPLGHGYDDGIRAALAVLDLLDQHPDHTMSQLIDTLTPTWQSPTMSPYCADEEKYQIVEQVTTKFKQAAAEGQYIADQKIVDLITINGVRIVLADGTWGLVRASSNKPELVVVVESPQSDQQMRAMFGAIDQELANYPQIGAYNQKI